MFTENDVKSFYRLCASQPQSASSKQLPPCVNLSTGAGVMLESAARDVIAANIRSGMERTSLFEIATDTGLDAYTVERLLPLDQTSWARIGLSGVMRMAEYELLRAELKASLSEGVVRSSAFCKEHHIDQELFRRLLPSQKEEWLSLGNLSIVFGRDFYQTIRSRVCEALERAEEPVGVDELISNDAVPGPLLAKVLDDILQSRGVTGTLDGALFTPEVYLVRQRERLAVELRKTGAIELGEASGAHTRGFMDFIDRVVPDATVLHGYLVTEEFIGRVKEILLNDIAKDGWSVVRDPESRLRAKDEKILQSIICKDLSDVEVVASIVVSKNLEKELVALASSLALERAEEDWKRAPNKEGLSGAVMQEVLKCLEAKKPLPPDVLSHYETKVLATVSSIYSEATDKLRHEAVTLAKMTFMDKYCLRLFLHKQGLQGIKDRALQSKLTIGTIEFARENGFSALTRLEDALHASASGGPEVTEAFSAIRSVLQAPYEASDAEGRLRDIAAAVRVFLRALDVGCVQEDALQAKKRAMVTEMRVQLQSTGDRSLQVLLVLLLVCGSYCDGLLRATGKYVPKLLKEVQKEAVLTEDQITLLSAAKSSVTSRGVLFTGDQVQALKNIGLDA